MFVLRQKKTHKCILWTDSWRLLC